MLEKLFIVLCGALQVVICGILGYIAGRIGKLYELMLEKVSKTDCERNMCMHEKDIRELRQLLIDKSGITKLEK